MHQSPIRPPRPIPIQHRHPILIRHLRLILIRHRRLILIRHRRLILIRHRRPILIRHPHQILIRCHRPKHCEHITTKPPIRNEGGFRLLTPHPCATPATSLFQQAGAIG